MTAPEEEMATEQLLRACAEDWVLLCAIKERLPRRISLIRRRGMRGRQIARETGVPEANVRYWTKNGTEAGAA